VSSVPLARSGLSCKEMAEVGDDRLLPANVGGNIYACHNICIHALFPIAEDRMSSLTYAGAGQPCQSHQSGKFDCQNLAVQNECA
jgi:nitrite reductase/ring-hydroxylating ferredoxin subunit